MVLLKRYSILTFSFLLFGLLYNQEIKRLPIGTWLNIDVKWEPIPETENHLYAANGKILCFCENGVFTYLTRILSKGNEEYGKVYLGSEGGFDFIGCWKKNECDKFIIKNRLIDSSEKIIDLDIPGKINIDTVTVIHQDTLIFNDLKYARFELFDDCSMKHIYYCSIKTAIKYNVWNDN